MCEPQELRLEPGPALHQTGGVMHDDMRQQLEGLWQQVVELRQEVHDTRQQLAHMQNQVSALYGLSQYVDPRRWLAKGRRWGKQRGARVRSVVLTPWRWLRVRLSRGKQVCAKLHPRSLWSLGYWALFGWVLWRGRLRRFYQHPRGALRYWARRFGRRQGVPHVTLTPQPESTGQPVNMLSRDATPEKLQEDVRYAIQVGQAWLNLLAADQINPQGKVILEIGPGINYGSTLVLACYGANVMVADRFLAPWEPDYHPQFYALLRDEIQKQLPGADVRPLDTILAHGGYTPDSLRCYATALEDLSDIPTASVDIIFSNAVLEHIYHPLAAFKSLARVAKPGGMGFHQVDFGDHGCRERPLDFLLMSQAEFARDFAERHGERGNRYRPWEYAQFFESVGFQVLKFAPSAFVNDAYLQEFMPRLRATAQARNRHAEAHMLKVIGGYYVVTRTATE